MNEVTETTFNHRINFTLFPSDPLLGINIHNAEVWCYDDKFRHIFSIELGLLFFKLSYSNINWK